MTLRTLPLAYVEEGTFRDLRLDSLLLHYCGLTDVPDLAGVCTALRVLLLSHNAISSIREVLRTVQYS